MSSVVWWASTWRSPWQATSRSISECRANSSSMWSRNPTPEATSDRPEPSRSRRRRMSVSRVLRTISAIALGHGYGPSPEIVSGGRPVRHRRIDGLVGLDRNPGRIQPVQDRSSLSYRSRIYWHETEMTRTVAESSRRKLARPNPLGALRKGIEPSPLE